MFGWRRKNTGLTDEELRKATLQRLAEVVGLPEGYFETSRASQPIPPKRAQGTSSEAGLSGAY